MHNVDIQRYRKLVSSRACLPRLTTTAPSWSVSCQRSPLLTDARTLPSSHPEPHRLALNQKFAITLFATIFNALHRLHSNQRQATNTNTLIFCSRSSKRNHALQSLCPCHCCHHCRPLFSPCQSRSGASHAIRIIIYIPLTAID